LNKIDINVTSFGVTKLKGIYDLDLDFFCNHILNENTLIDFVFPTHKQSFRCEQEFKNKIKRAAKKVYASPKYQARGEFGELILHVMIRDYFGGIPLIRKIFFKSSTNDTVKGYDGVFIVKSESSCDIWLGESKLYTSISSVYANLRNSLLSNANSDYLENEFICLADHIDKEFEERYEWENIMTYIRSHDDLKKAFNKVIIPVFVGYETTFYSTIDFIKNIYTELTTIESKIRKDNSDLNLELVIIIFPIESKQLFLDKMNEILRGF
jgi:hypothetical protein